MEFLKVENLQYSMRLGAGACAILLFGTASVWANDCPIASDLENGIILETTTVLFGKTSISRTVYQQTNGNLVRIHNETETLSGVQTDDPLLPAPLSFKGLIPVNESDTYNYMNMVFNPAFDRFFPLKTGAKIKTTFLLPSGLELDVTIEVLGKTERMIADCRVSFFQIRYTTKLLESDWAPSGVYLYSEELGIWLDDPVLFAIRGNDLMQRKYTRFVAAASD